MLLTEGNDEEEGWKEGVGGGASNIKEFKVENQASISQQCKFPGFLNTKPDEDKYRKRPAPKVFRPLLVYLSLDKREREEE